MKTFKLLILLLPLNVVAQTIKVIDLQINDLLYNPYDNKLYATVPGSEGYKGNSICIIDPITAQIDTTIFIGNEPYKIKLSDNGNMIYVALDEVGAIREFNVSTLTAGQQFTLGSDPISGPFYVEDMEFLKGSENSVAISRKTKKFFPIHEGVGIYDNGIVRPNTTKDHTGSNAIEIISDSLLVGYSNESSEFGLRVMKIDSYGVKEIKLTRNLFSGYDLDIYYSRGRLYSTNGRVLDVSTGIPNLFATFYQASGQIVEDTTLNLVCYAFKMSNNRVAIKRYSRDKFIIVDTIISSTGITGNILNLITWGSNGKYALNTSGGKIVIIDQSDSENIEYDNTINFTISPEKTVDYVTISAPSHFERCKIQLKSLNGIVLKEELVIKFPHVFDLKNHISGTYYIVLQKDENSGFQKIIKL